MFNIDDMQLLGEYARTNSEPAFAEIVSRYTNLVYSVALRQVQDPHLAEEVAQAVFIILARKAGSLSPDIILSGWLCRTARYASANALTIQRRRQRHEQELADVGLESMNNEAWNRIGPMLDAGMEQLGVKDHDVLVLRFFDGFNFREVGAALGISEDAAKMRVNRALEKLRKFFINRGVTLTVAVIAEAVAANSVQAAPVVLGQSIIAVAIGSSSLAAASTLTMATATMNFMAWMKLKFALGIGVAALLAATVVGLALSPSPTAANSISPTHYAMSGSLTWEWKTNRQTYPVEIFRDGATFKMKKIQTVEETNYYALGYLATSNLALSYSQYTKDITGAQKVGKAWNNGNVDISHFRMPNDAQVAPIWLVFRGREEFKTMPRLVSIFPNTGEHYFHERPTIIPVTQFDAAWASGFSRYSELTTNESGTAQSVTVAVESWTNCAGIKFPASVVGRVSRKANRTNVEPQAVFDLVFRFQTRAISSLDAAIDTRIPFLSRVIDWRPREDGRSEYGCGYDVTNGVIVDDVMKAIAENKIHNRPALDWGQSQGGLKKGDVAPEFAGETLAGKQIKLSDFRGKYVLLSFWSTTCGPCIGEMPTLKETYAASRDNSRFAMIGIALDSPEDVEKFAKKNGIDWPQIPLSKEFGDPICKSYKIQGIPTDYVIDPEGKIVAKLRGTSKEYIKALLSK